MVDNQNKPFLRVPGFLVEHEIGLGDLTKTLFYRLGAKPCTGCEQRATKLNHFMVFKASGGRK